jgi:hypothetical protein
MEVSISLDLDPDDFERFDEIHSTTEEVSKSRGQGRLQPTILLLPVKAVLPYREKLT